MTIYGNKASFNKDQMEKFIAQKEALYKAKSR